MLSIAVVAGVSSSSNTQQPCCVSMQHSSRISSTTLFVMPDQPADWCYCTSSGYETVNPLASLVGPSRL